MLRLKDEGGRMEKLIESFKNKTIELYGKRLEGGKCNFCGSELGNGEYCKCKEAKLRQRFYKKAAKKLSSYYDFMALGGIENARNTMKSKFKIPAIFEGYDFDFYETNNSSQKNALDSVLDYDKNIVRNFLNGTNLILLGNYGTGKTMLMSILCNKIVEDYLFDAKFVNGIDLVNKIKSTFHDTSTVSALQIAELYRNVEFLFIDDIDKLKPSDYVRELMYSIVNYRIENELPIIISANHDLDDLDEKYFGEATISRLAANGKSKIVRFSHQNWRVA